MNVQSGDAGEALFERYLNQWGYRYTRQADQLNPPKVPDFLVHTPVEVVAEVKSFTTGGLFENAVSGEAVSRPLSKALSPIRSAIKAAANQLKGIPDRPLVVVLANPMGQPLPLNAPLIVSAMYGDLAYSFGDPEGWQFGRNGRLYVIDDEGNERGYHDHISAIAVVRNAENITAWFNAWWDEHADEYPSPEAALMDLQVLWDQAPEIGITLDVFETVSDRCVPLPANVFFHPGDTRWGEIAPGKYGLRATAAV